jgi:hypothetical protein
MSHARESAPAMATPADKLQHTLDKIDKDKLKQKFDLSHFGLNAVIRGAQLTLVGAHRALQNPALFTSDHYRQAAIAVAAGIAIRLLIAIPTIGVRVLLWALSFFVSMDAVGWDDTLVNGLHFVENYVLQVPFFLMALMRYITPTLDNLFMDSLKWVDRTYVAKHKHDDPAQLRPMYYPQLSRYRHTHGSAHTSSPVEAATHFCIRSGKRAAISLAVYAMSFLPLVGWLVLPAASFYTFHRAVGLGPASVIFGTGVFLPRHYLVVFLQSYFASRSLVRDLLEPYFARVRFSPEQKRSWFRSREGLLFGFGVGFYAMIRIPLVGVLMYGIAEASTAYLVTKITDPPPLPEQSEGFAASQQEWRNKHEFLDLSLANLDMVRPAREEKEK